VGVDSVAVDEGELGEGLFPAGGGLAFDEVPSALRLAPRRKPASLARSRARLSSMVQMASHSSLITASSLGSGRGF
jgi:hypothetical protein